jgi:hypothetical protein
LGSAAEVRDALEPSRAFSGFDRGSGGTRLPTPNVKPNAKGNNKASRDPTLQPTMPMSRIQLEPERPRTSIKRIAIGVVVGGSLLAGGFAAWNNYGDRLDVSAMLQRIDPRARTPAPVVVAHDTTPTKKPIATKPESGAPHAKPAAVPPGTVPGTTAVVRTARDSQFVAPLDKLTKALASGDMDLVTKSFPGITIEQRKTFEALFASADHLKATPTYGPPSVDGDHAEMTYDVVLKYLYKNTGQQSGTPPLHYRAEFVHRYGVWQLVSLKD